MILALLLACNPFKGIEDRWNGAWDACDPDSVEGTPDPYDLDSTLSAECQDRLLDDLKADRDSLATVLATDETPSLTACLTTGAYDLLTREGGRFNTTEAGDGVYDIYVEQMQEVYWQLGGDDNRQLAYNYTTWFTSAVVADADMADEFQTGTYEDGLHLGSSVLTRCGVELSHLLFHEAGHAELPLHVPCPDDFEIQDCPDCEDTHPAACDEDDRGTIALEASLLELWGRECEDVEDPVCGYIEDIRWVTVQLIAPEGG